MGFFDRLENIFNKKEKINEEDEKEIKCSFNNCLKDSSGICRFCGKPFCKDHIEPLKHGCEKEMKVLEPIQKKAVETMDIPQTQSKEF